MLKNKATLEIIVEKDSFSYSELVTGKIIITPLDDFTSNELNIGVQYYAFMNLSGVEIVEKISRLCFPGTEFTKGDTVEINFEFSFINTNEIKDIILNQFNSEEEYNEVQNELGIENEKFSIFADFDIPGLDVHEYVNVNKV